MIFYHLMPDVCPKLVPLSNYDKQPHSNKQQLTMNTSIN